MQTGLTSEHVRRILARTADLRGVEAALSKMARGHVETCAPGQILYDLLDDAPAGPSSTPIARVVLAGHVELVHLGDPRRNLIAGPLDIFGEEAVVDWLDGRPPRPAFRAMSLDSSVLLEIPASIFRDDPEAAAAIRRAGAVREHSPAFIGVLRRQERLLNAPQEALSRLLEGGEIVERSEGPILRAGAVPDAYYVLLDGAFEYHDHGHKRSSKQGPGVTGLNHILDRRPMELDVHVVSARSPLLKLEAATVRELCRTDDGFRRTVLYGGVAAADDAPAFERRAYVVAADPDATVPPPVRALCDLLAERLARHLYDHVLVLHVEPARAAPGGEREHVIERLPERIPGAVNDPEAPVKITHRWVSGAGGLRPLVESARREDVDVILLETTAYARGDDPLLEVQDDGAEPLFEILYLIDRPGALQPPQFLANGYACRYAALVRRDEEASPPEGPVPSGAAASGTSALRKKATGALSTLRRMRELSEQPWPMGTVRLHLQPALGALLAAGREAGARGGVVVFDRPPGAGAGAGGIPEVRPGFDEKTATALRGNLDRCARAATGRRVGVALGGGGGYARVHVPLLRKLVQAGVPVDLVSGTSMGSFVGGYFCALAREGEGEAGLLRGLDAFAGAFPWVLRAGFASFFSSLPLQLVAVRDLGLLSLGQSEIPFFPVVTDGDMGVEWNLRSGTFAKGLRASGSLPPLIGPTMYGNRRYLDGGLVAQVPIDVLRGEGAALVVASNAIASVEPRRREDRGSLLSAVRRRVEDALRSLPLIFRGSGETQAAGADVVYRPAVGESSFAGEPDNLPDSPELAEKVRDVLNRFRLLLRRAPSVVRAKPGEIVLDTPIAFTAGTAEITAAGARVLDELAGYIKANPRLGVVVVKVDGGLDAERETSLIEWLAGAGVDRARLQGSRAAARAGGSATARDEPVCAFLLKAEFNALELRTVQQALRYEQARLLAKSLIIEARRKAMAGDPDLVRMLAIEAGERDPSIDGDAILRLGLSQQGAEAHRFTFEAWPERLSFHPEGEVLAVAAGALSLCETRGGNRIEVLCDAELKSTRVAFDPGGRRLASARIADQRLLVHERSGAASGPFRLVARDALGTWDLLDLSFSRDGKTLFGGARKAPRVWSLDWALASRPADGGASPEPMELRPFSVTLDMQGASALSAALTADGSRAATGEVDGTVKVWSTADGSLLTVPMSATQQPIATLAWHPDGDRLAVGGERGIWIDRLGPDGALRGEPQELTGHRGRVELLLWDGPGRLLLSVARDGTARLWDAGARLSAILTTTRGSITGAAFHVTREVAATWTDGGEVAVWGLRRGERIATFTGNRAAVTAAAFRPGPAGDGWLATASEDRTVRLWDPGLLQMTTYLRHQTDQVSSAAWHPTRREMVVTAGRDGSVHVWAPGSNALLLDLFGEAYEAHAVREPANAFALTWHTGVPAQGGVEDDAAAGQEDDPRAGPAPVRAFAAWSPDGKWLAAARVGNRQLRVTGVPEAGQPWPDPILDAVGLDNEPVLASDNDDTIAWSASSRYLSVKRLKRLVAWDLATRREVGRVFPGRNTYDQADLVDHAWSPTRPRLAVSQWTADAETVRIFDVPEGGGGTEVWRPSARLRHGDGVHRVAWSPDGLRLATSDNRKLVNVFDVPAAAIAAAPQALVPAVSIALETPAHALAWSPEGAYLAFGDEGGLVTILDTGSLGATSRSLVVGHERHKKGVTCVLWSRDGRRLFSGGCDTVLVWELAGGSGKAARFELVSRLTGQQGRVRCVSPSPDGHQLLSGGDGGTARVDPIGREALLDALAARLQRKQMSEEEWREAMGHGEPRPTWPRPEKEDFGS